MEVITLNNHIIDAYERVIAGKGEVHRLRNEGFVPGIIYGNGKNTPVSLHQDDIQMIVDKHMEEAPLNINMGAGPLNVKIKDIQVHPVTREVRHIDLIPVG